MSDTDDRMERAERIRKMRGSRDRDETDQGRADDEGDGDDGTVTDIDRTAGNAADADGANQQETTDEQDHATGATATADREDASETDRAEPAARTQPEESTREARNVTRSDTEDGSDPESSSETDARPPDVTAQAARSDAAVTEIGASAADVPQSGASTAEAASATPAAGSAGSGGLAPLGEAAGFSLTDEETAQLDDAAEDESTTDARARGSETTTSEPSVRVLEFTVGGQAYCIDIECVEEIVKRDAVTRVPNTNEYVEGVVDLRGQITTILDTKQLLDVTESGPGNLLVIFAPEAFEEHGTVGWVVDEVRQVVPVTDSQVRTAPSDDDHVRGVVDRDEDDLVVWIRPGDAMDQAVAVDDE